MRPPQNAGENHGERLRVGGVGGASMRPPQNAGENLKAKKRKPPGPPRFNEAPAECGGKPEGERKAEAPANGLQ